MAEQKGTGRPYCSSVGKSGMEAHFLNEGIYCQKSSEWQEQGAGFATVALVFPFPLWFLPQCHTMPAVIQGNLLLFQSTWV